MKYSEYSEIRRAEEVGSLERSKKISNINIENHEENYDLIIEENTIYEIDRDCYNCRNKRKG